MGDIQTIDPKIEFLSPSLGLFSDTTNVKIFVNGFDIASIDENDLQITVADTNDKVMAIETFEVQQNEKNESFILTTLGKFTKFDEKEICIKYKEMFEIKSMFFAHDAIKITSVSPNSFALNEAGKVMIKFDTKQQIDKKYVSECEIKMSANDKSVVLCGNLSDDGKCIEAEFNEECFGDIGAAKKAQIEISFNNQQWVKAKATVSLK